MFGKSIYRKLYISFLVIFLVALIVVLLVSSRFFSSHLRDEIQDYTLAQARFLRTQYSDACVRQDSKSAACRDFLSRVDSIDPVKIWVLDPSGVVHFSNSHQVSGVEFSDIRRAATGEDVVAFRHRESPLIVLPVKGQSGNISSLLVMQRSELRARRFPRFPFMVSLLVAGIVIAVLVWPLSSRITRPIRQLHQLGQQWAEGHLEKRAEIKGKDEISELGKVFNIMAENLQKMLQQRKEFLALISHELKSPLTRMRIALELISEREPQSAEKLKILNGIERDIEESEKLIEQLLILSRVEMGLQSSFQDNVDLQTIVKSAVDQAQPIAQNVGISLAQSPTTETFKVSGNTFELQRAIGNVIENAIKYSPAGGQVEIQLTKVDRLVGIKVADGGSGIPSEEHEKIFEPFYRGKDAAGKQGSGLGLFIARRIVEQHGGTIAASENSPRGTVITILLPAA